MNKYGQLSPNPGYTIQNSLILPPVCVLFRSYHSSKLIVENPVTFGTGSRIIVLLLISQLLRICSSTLRHVVTIIRNYGENLRPSFFRETFDRL